MPLTEIIRMKSKLALGSIMVSNLHDNDIIVKRSKSTPHCYKIVYGDNG